MVSFLKYNTKISPVALSSAIYLQSLLQNHPDSKYSPPFEQRITEIKCLAYAIQNSDNKEFSQLASLGTELDSAEREFTFMSNNDYHKQTKTPETEIANTKRFNLLTTLFNQIERSKLFAAANEGKLQQHLNCSIKPTVQ